MAIKERKKGVDLRVENTMERLREHQKNWETEEGLREFLRFVRREDIPDALKQSIRKEMGKL